MYIGEVRSFPPEAGLAPRKKAKKSPKLQKFRALELPISYCISRRNLQTLVHANALKVLSGQFIFAVVTTNSKNDMS